MKNGWLAAVALAALWGLGPALPAVLEGGLIGQPFTDLYPAVWGMWSWPSGGDWLGWPDGIDFYYASPLKAALAWPIKELVGLTMTWNSLCVLARMATVLCAFGAARAWGFSSIGALTAAAAYGCSPFFQGYAVEGITEGVDGWALALWAWAAGARRPLLAAVGLALAVLSSWYLGAAACLLAVLAGLRDRRHLLALLGLLPIAPALWSFLGAQGTGAPLAPEIRAAMGASLQIPTPGITEGLNPFAINAYIGLSLGLAALLSRSRYLLAALAPMILSLGIGPLYELPLLEAMRFPYRWHAATLALLAAAAATTADARGWRWLAPLIVVEGLLLSPIEPVLPSAPAAVPAIYAAVDGPIVEIPGPVSRPPGEINRSRPRSRYVLYYQTAHRQPSPWRPDLNGLGETEQAEWLYPLRTWDPVEGLGEPAALTPAVIAALRDAGVHLVMIHRRELGSRGPELVAALEAVGAVRVGEDGERWLLWVGEAR
ncbi:MAG: hypothetical protein P8R54_17750 [Myxococcota bacterium]|nr:hypothetical protein [Myxococcota bacterium]